MFLTLSVWRPWFNKFRYPILLCISVRPRSKVKMCCFVLQNWRLGISTSVHHIHASRTLANSSLKVEGQPCKYMPFCRLEIVAALHRINTIMYTLNNSEIGNAPLYFQGRNLFIWICVFPCVRLFIYLVLCVCFLFRFLTFIAMTMMMEVVRKCALFIESKNIFQLFQMRGGGGTDRREPMSFLFCRVRREKGMLLGGEYWIADISAMCKHVLRL